MTGDVCPRTWEVEAVRDGRLDRASLEAHREHIARCRVCQREQAALASYLTDMSRIEHDAMDDVRVRHMKQAVLTEVRRSRSIEATHQRWPWLVAAIAVATIALLAARSHEPAQSPSSVDVTSQGVAYWQRALNAQEERIVLTAGTLRFRVTHTDGARRLTVVVPEGEIEDVGTTFSVSVEHARTVAIKVSEGSVVFHRRGKPDLHLPAGSGWAPAAVRSSPAEPPTAKPEPQALQARSTAPPTDSGAHAPHKRHTNSASAEDEAYLRVIHHLRNDHRLEATIAAESYLRAFPTGLRQPEIARLVRELHEQDAGSHSR